jgi:hypothetical protein
VRIDFRRCRSLGSSSSSRFSSKSLFCSVLALKRLHKSSEFILKKVQKLLLPFKLWPVEQ